MPAIYNSQSYTVNGKTVHLKWLEADLDEITVRSIGSKDVSETSYYGVNGVLFNADTSVCCFAMQNGVGVRTGGDQNGHYGYLIRLNNSLGPTGIFLASDDPFNLPCTDGSPTVKFPLYYKGYYIEKSNVKWAVGGVGLRISDSSLTTRKAFLDKADKNGTICDSWNNRPRTAIGYKPGNRIILCTFFDPNDYTNRYGGCDVWDVRTVMKNKFGCSIGINLDGGGSTQISYYTQNGGKCCAMVSPRKVQTMITVPM